ncbi:hypothetical protein LAZ67_X004532 [Cordylochernes scorpioides]|uniref:RNA-directed DNA polymerase n=1 Tax=Cordylochernes scorpioides TaxID=51811 RepID=A0ABY6LXM0_9ARAC|nr:hypothetical protein LAZ67_X004532 [Cordylochernes scorpioides]
MAQIEPPETFDFSTPNEWPKWRKRFERYLVVSGMKKKEEADKIDLFMYLMGDRADDIFRTFKFEKEEEATKIDSVLKAFDSHFCLDSELTLQKTVKLVRQQEAVRQQQIDLQRPSTSQKVNQVKFNSKKQSPKQQQQPSRKKEKSAKIRSRCPKCGGFTHREGQACRAEGQRCNQCSKTGHFANCCPDKQAKTAEVKAVSEHGEEIGFLLEVSAVEDSSNLDDDEGECRRRWTAEIQVNGKQVKFKLDSQADVTCVPLCLFKKIMGQQRLVESDISIRAAEFSELQTVCMFISTLRNGNYEIKEKIYVIRRLSEPLLSRRACELLNLARRIEVVATRINPIKEFPEVHIPGKELLDADALSRQPLLTTEGGENERPTSAHINAVLSSITNKDEMLTKIFEAQQEDTTLKAVVNYLEQGWPDKKKMSQALLSYWHVKDELGVQNGLLMRSCRLVIPASMKLEILDKLHAGHFGITKTRLRARETVWWPGISEESAETVRKCSVCVQEAVSKHEPLIPTNFPTRSWQKIGMDLFKFENKWYLVVIDYYSRFPETIQLDRLTANVVVRSCKSIFARHGIPETVVSDNGTQFGAAHPSLGLLEYRLTPLENGYSLAELLMGRKLRTTLPIAPENLNPRLVDSQTLKRKEGRRRKDMKSRYDRRCGAADMEELSEGDTVWITDMRIWGIVKQKASTPRSYMVDTPVDLYVETGSIYEKELQCFSGEELVENEKTPVVDYPSNDSEDGQIRTRIYIVKRLSGSNHERPHGTPVNHPWTPGVRGSLNLAGFIRRIVREEIQKVFSAPEVINPLREVNALEQTVREEVGLHPNDMDDIVAYAPTFEEHLRRLQLVLRCIQKAGLNLHHKKYPDKVKAVSKFPRPRNISELRSFLGLCSYYRRFIENSADKARSLHDLLKTEKQFYWDAAQEKAFEVLKTALISEPVSWDTLMNPLIPIYTRMQAGMKDPSGRLARWALKLQEFDVTVIYKSGRKHKDADCLSRSPLENDQPSSVMSLTNVDIEQTKDPDLAKIIDNLNSGYTRKEFSIIDGILYKKNYSTTGRPWLMMIPKHLRSEIMADLHDAPTAGHLGFARTYDKCQRRKKLPRRPAGQLVSIPPVEKPFYKVGVDLLGRFLVSKDGNRWIIVCTDYMTRYAITKAIPDGGAIETAKFLVEDVILKHGAPREMITDRGRNFISQVIKEINALCGIVHRFTTAYHPHTNGLTERFNKTLGDMLSMYTGVEQKDWDQVLPYVTFAYNTAKQEATGYTPFFLVHAREAETYIDAVLPYLPDEISDDSVGELVTRAEEARQLSRSRLLQSQAKDRRLYDQKHTPVYYQKDDLVWVFTPIRKVGLSEKLLKRYFGPYKVTKKLSEVTYEVEPVDPSPRSRKAKDIVHVIRMKPYLDPEEQHSILLGNTSRDRFPSREQGLRQANQRVAVFSKEGVMSSGSAAPTTRGSMGRLSSIPGHRV